MRIAQVVSTFPPYKGGMGTVAFHYSLELGKRGHEVTVVTPHYKRRQMTFHNFKLLGLRAILRFGNAAFCPQFLWKLCGYDLVHLHYPFFGGDVFVALARRIGCIQRLVITYHMDVVGGTGLKSRYFAWHTRHLMPWVLASADRVIVTSRDYAESGVIAPLLTRYPQRFVEVPLGAKASIFKPLPKNAALVRRYHLTPTDTVLLFVATLDRPHYFKGLHLLLDSLKSLPAATHLIVVGRGEMQGYYAGLARQLGLERRVHFAGYVSDFDLAEYYNLCDIFVLPSTDKSEAFGLVYVEAMSCGKPVVGSRLPGVRTVIDDTVNGRLITPGSVAELTAALSDLLVHPELRVAYGAAGLEKVQSRYTWKQVVSELEVVYRDVMGIPSVVE